MIVVGDVHGNWRDLAERIRASDLRGAHILQVGDFGLGFDPPARERERLADLDRALALTEGTLYAIRGNHDDPAYWRPGHPWRYRTIRLVPDYTVLAVQGAHILCVGGAISVDRILRRRNGGYWPDEGFALDEARLAALDLADLWGVLTHSAPDLAPPYEIAPAVRGYLDVDPTLSTPPWPMTYAASGRRSRGSTSWCGRARRSPCGRTATSTLTASPRTRARASSRPT